MFEIIKENLDIITRGIIRTVIVRFTVFLGLFLFVSFGIILIWGALGNGSKNIKCEDKTQSGITVTGDCNNEGLRNKNLFELRDDVVTTFINFLSNEWYNIMLLVFAFIIVYQLIIPPRWFDEFLDRIYHYFLERINKDDKLKDLIFVTKNITKGNGFIRFSIKWIPQNIHFELYVMDFKAELKKDSPILGQKDFDKLNGLLKLWTKQEYLQLQLHFEDINKDTLPKLKEFEQKYLTKYNIIPHCWDLPKLKAHLGLDTINAWYILESKISRKDILQNDTLHEKFYKDAFTRVGIYNIFKEEILDSKKNWKDKFLASYIDFSELSRNDIKIMAENYLQAISYYLKNDEFLKDLQALVCPVSDKKA